MNFIKKFFPFSFNFTTTKEFVWTIILYVVAEVVAGVVLGIMSKIPFVGFVFSTGIYLTGVYVTAGIVFAILKKVNVFKF